MILFLLTFSLLGGCQSTKATKFSKPSIEPSVQTTEWKVLTSQVSRSTSSSTGSLREVSTDGQHTQPETESDIDLELSQSADAKPSNSTTLQVSLITLAEPTRETASTTPLTLEQVLTSVTNYYPDIEVAIAEIEAAEGKLLASWGEFDTTFAGYSISEPLGFYQTYRNEAGAARPLWNGGKIYGSYKIGRGNFEPWYGERETNDGGEFKAGFALPLLKDRAIDDRRAAVKSAEAGVAQTEAGVNSRLLQLQRVATQAYWDWVATGRAVQVQQQLLELAAQRVRQINERVEKGDLATLAKLDNQRFIAKRQNSLIKARRALQKAAIKLSLFYRNEDCFPIIVASKQLPLEFPDSQRISDEERESDIATAIAVRPELQELQAARRQANIDLQYARNLMMPKLNMVGYAAKDVGAPTEKNDKTPFQLQLGVLTEVPIQRRKAFGKIQAAQSKLVQIDAKSRFVTDKIRAEIQDAASAVNAALEQIEQSQLNVNLTQQSLELGRKSFEVGDIDLIALNIYETAVADAELQLLDAQFKYLSYRTIYETAKSAEAFR